jgi:hypothetical protein
MPAIALGTAAAAAKPLAKATGWLLRGFGNLGRSPLFTDAVGGALNAASAGYSGRNSGNTQRVGKGVPGESTSVGTTGYSSEGGNKNVLLYIGGLVAVLLLMKK